ncbi:hypothetical protein BDV23DRAFT_113032 [Aspergillus alliaceus]|uniref:Uncharacterized protein n=1 Tax=Petromyces alliaceus TaxID=209559 RepID=A0A5N7C3E2_PETAA|nr:hypothetical protein BDV23DRAFT_113032 [Aspergillus alliaceus]
MKYEEKTMLARAKYKIENSERMLCNQTFRSLFPILHTRKTPPSQEIFVLVEKSSRSEMQNESVKIAGGKRLNLEWLTNCRNTYHKKQ